MNTRAHAVHRSAGVPRAVGLLLNIGHGVDHMFLAARAPENAQFARDLSVSYWKCASITQGDAQTHWWNKVHSKPYRVIYRVIGKQVIIYLIADGRRDMQSLLSRRLLGAWPHIVPDARRCGSSNRPQGLLIGA